MKIKIYLAILCVLFFSGQAVNAQVYRTSWDNAAQRQGWTQYQLGLDSNSTWAYTPVAVLTGEVLIHTAPPSSNMNVTDNWIVSPAFNFSAGGRIDSLIFNLSGVSVPAANDRLGIYLVNGSQNPTIGSWQLLKQFDSTDYMLNGGTYQNIDSIMIPPTSGTSFIAFRYKTINSQFDAVFDALQVTAHYPNAINDVHQKENVVKIFPNPSSGLFTIELTDKWGRIENVSVFDTRGRKMQAAYKQQQLDISNLASGVYFVRISNAKAGVFVERIVIK